MLKRFLFSPFTRISFGITLLTLSFVFISDTLKIFPHLNDSEIEKRKILAETITLRTNQILHDQDNKSLIKSLQNLVEKNTNIVSVAILSDGKTVHSFGKRHPSWQKPSHSTSTVNNMLIPISSTLEDNWGELQIQFTQLPSNFSLNRGTLLSFVLFLTPCCLLGYFIFLRQALTELDPNKAIPQRVSSALDTLTEGLVIIDKNRHILFSNHAFSKIAQKENQQLIGKNINSLPWASINQEEITEKAWDLLLQGETPPQNAQLRLKVGVNSFRSLSINVSTITGNNHSSRGLLITFEDITQLEKHNTELASALDRIKRNQKEIERQNLELMFLATHDPLTNLLNRRSFFEKVKPIIEESKKLQKKICVAMVDIDFFKKINDNYGHSTGDKVISDTAKLLKSSLPNDALICRYGGEEFCVFLPETPVSEGAQILENLRKTIAEHTIESLENTVSATVSQGISNTGISGYDIEQLLENADNALYVAKENGRNRVVIWQGEDKAPLQFSNTPRVVQDDSNQNEEAETEKDSPANHLAPISCDQQALSSMEANTSPVINTQTNTSAYDSSQQKTTNRFVVLDQISQAIKEAQRTNSSIAVLAIKVSEASRIGSIHGITAAEMFIFEAMKRVQSVLRETDSIAMNQFDDHHKFSLSRVNNDELIVLLKNLDNHQTITVIISRIYEALKDPLEIDNHNFLLNVNIGIAFASQKDQNAELILANASAALQELNSKNEVNAFEFHNESMRDELKRKITLESDLVHAIENEELALVYQPQVNLNTGEIRGFEALIRWHHPTMGLVPPTEFIPIAENCGSIQEISLWAIKEACNQQRIWMNNGALNLVASINISAKDLKNTDFASTVFSIVQDSVVDPNMIELEVTEGILIKNIEHALNEMQRLRDIGIKIAIDDFGVGYSNLSYIKRFPATSLKIDKLFIDNFIDDTDDAAITNAIIAMGHSLNLEVVAEGVESVDQLRFLQEMNCDFAQGFHISKPITGEETLDYLANVNSTRNEIRERANIDGLHSDPQVLMGLLNSNL